jgi:hypothetical protein
MKRLPNEEWLLNPEPGTAAAAAREFGIDLSLTVENLRLTPRERLEKLDNHLEFIEAVRRASKFKPSAALQRWQKLYWNDHVLFDAWRSGDRKSVERRLDELKREAAASS